MTGAGYNGHLEAGLRQIPLQRIRKAASPTEQGVQLRDATELLDRLENPGFLRNLGDTIGLQALLQRRVF